MSITREVSHVVMDLYFAFAAEAFASTAVWSSALPAKEYGTEVCGRRHMRRSRHEHLSLKQLQPFVNVRQGSDGSVERAQHVVQVGRMHSRVKLLLRFVIEQASVASAAPKLDAQQQAGGS